MDQSLISSVRKVNNQWTRKSYITKDFVSENNTDQNELLFFKSKDHHIDGALRRFLNSKYHIPNSYWDELFLRSNGFARCEPNEEKTGCIIYFRFLVKFVKRLPNGEDQYYWNEMTFLFHVGQSNSFTALCIDTPPDLRLHLTNAFEDSKFESAFQKMAHMTSSLVGEIVTQCDNAVWQMRDVIRGVEKERGSPEGKEPDFFEIHNQARHAIHISEVLEVAVRTVAELQDCIRVKPNSWAAFGHTPPDPPTLEFNHSKEPPSGVLIKSDLQHCLHLLRNVQLRSEAIEKRFNNEINLAFNLVTQNDTNAMKTIAVVTLSFLPATFVSTVFGMTFFNTTPNSVTGKPEWQMAPQFWIFWVVAVPLTLATLAVWKWWEFTLTGWKFWRARATETGTKIRKNASSLSSKLREKVQSV